MKFNLLLSRKIQYFQHHYMKAMKFAFNIILDCPEDEYYPKIPKTLR